MAMTPKKAAPKPKVTPKPVVNKNTGQTTKQSKPTLTKAEKGIAAELSPKGVKKTEKMQKNAIDKKYPGMFKK